VSLVLYRLFFWPFIVIVIFAIAVPILYLGYEGSIGRFSNLSRSFSHEVLSSITLTIVASAIATAMALVIGAPVAYYLARYRSRGIDFIEALIDLPTSVPPSPGWDSHTTHDGACRASIASA